LIQRFVEIPFDKVEILDAKGDADKVILNPECQPFFTRQFPMRGESRNDENGGYVSQSRPIRDIFGSREESVSLRAISL
jgi:hypothetical protein